jgi:hypothetical protein
VRRSFFLAVVPVLCFAGMARADKIGPPGTYKTLSTDGKYVFVMLSPRPAEQELKSYNEEHQKVVKAIRDTYKQSGLYKNDDFTNPLWTVDWYRRSVVVAADGVHVVGYGGPHTFEQRLNKDKTNRVITQNDLKKEAITIFARGKLLREFSIGEFVDDPKVLPKSTSFFRWSKQVKIIDDQQQLTIVTLDGNRILIDLATATIRQKKKAD